MRRHRLAERRKAVGLSQEQLADNLGVDRSTVVRWERADTDPQPWHRPRLAHALRLTVDELAILLAEGKSDRGRAPKGVLQSERESAHDSSDDIAVLQALRKADCQLGGGYLYPSLAAYLQMVVNPSLDDRVRSKPDAILAAAGLTEMAGWMAHDAGQDFEAAQHFERALAMTTADPGHPLGAHICGSLSHLSYHLGRPTQAAGYAEQGLARLRAVPPELDDGVKARLLAMVARGRAAVGDERDCTFHLRKAEVSLAHEHHTERSPWIPVFDEASLAAEAVRCFQQLGRSQAARHQAARVLQLRPPDRARSRAFAQLAMTRVLLAQAEPEAACALGLEVLGTTGALSSYQVIQQLEGLREAFAPFGTAAEVVPFLEQLRDELHHRRWLAQWLPHARPPEAR